MSKIITKLVLALALIGMSAGAFAQSTYVITGNGTTFTATKNGTAVATDKPLQDVINSIKLNANGADCIIQLGSGGDNSISLGIGDDVKIRFEGAWGNITLTGTATTLSTSTDGNIRIESGVSVESKMNLSTVLFNSILFYNSGGTLTVSEGEITSIDGGAIGNADGGTLLISGGTVYGMGVAGIAVLGIGSGSITVSGTATLISDGMVFGGTIVVQHTHTLNITGGTIENRVGPYVVYNVDTGTVNISGGTLLGAPALSETVPSCVVLNYTGTVNISGGTFSGALYGVLNIDDGTVKVSGGTIVGDGFGIGNGSTGTVNISNGTVSSTGVGIWNASTGTINISGGMISSTLLGAVVNSSTGTVNVSGGIIRAKEGYAMNNLGTGTVAVSGGIGFAWGTGISDVVNGNINLLPGSSASLVAWNHAAGNTTYEAGTNTDLFVYPTEITVAWAKKDGVSGVTGTLGSITGFLPVEDVTVIDGTGIGDGVETWHDASVRVYPNPTSGELFVTRDALRVTSDELQVTSVEIFDIMGRACNVSRVTRNENEMDISFLPPGVYFVRIQTETGVVTRKVVKR